MPAFSSPLRIRNKHLEFVGGVDPGLSTEGTARIYFDDATGKVLLSKDGGAYGVLFPPEEAPETYEDLILATPGLLAYYPFDTALGVLTDLGPSGYDLTGVGYLSVPGIENDGIDIGVGNTLQRTLSQAEADTFQGVTGSLELWAKYRGSGTNLTFATQENSETPAEPLQLTFYPVTPRVEATVNTTGTPTIEHTTAFETAVPAWEHFVYAFDGAGLSKLYKNGVEVSSITSTGASLNCPNDSNPLLLLFGGDVYLDEVAWYSTMLSPADIAAHYAAGLL